MFASEKTIRANIADQQRIWVAHVYCLELNIRQRNFIAARRRLNTMRDLRSTIFTMENALRCSRAVA